MNSRYDELEILISKFTRPLPDLPAYAERLEEELEIIANLNFAKHFLRVREILDLTRDIPHITRGSAGSSLLCWLMGISDVDPIRERIPLSRFMNPKRDDLPDIDLDFPHWQQATVMNRIFKRWPGQSARVSNYVMYKEKSARREAAKRMGAKGTLKRNFTFEEVVPDYVEDAERLTQKLMGKKRCISKHCGGILIFDRAVPKSLINGTNQILLDKYEVEDLEHFKIDILANRGLSQLMEIDPTRMIHEYPAQDEVTSDLLARGDVLGVTQGESPAMRRLFRAIRPTSVADCVFATALVRPVAMEGRRKAAWFRDWTADGAKERAIICEDDAIERIMKLIGVNAYEADMYRRAFAKKNEEKVMEFMNRLGDHPLKDDIYREMLSLSGFGLCRAHAVNLGRLIWALAYQKAHNPKEFWRAALMHCQGSYARWVYRNEAKRAGWDLRDLGFANWITEDAVASFKEHGAWNSPGFLPSMGVQSLYSEYYQFAGIVANSRVFKRDRKQYIHFITLGVGEGEYVDVIVDRPVKYHTGSVIVGQGRRLSRDGSQFLQVDRKDVAAMDIDDYLNLS